MSYERARVACELCYGHAESLRDFEEDNKVAIVVNTIVIARDQARFNAMQALEETAQTGRGYDSGDWGRSQKALRVCESCDYSGPKIAELLQIKT